MIDHPLYHLELLRMPHLENLEGNGRLLGDHTLGIEVTNILLAKKCGLGNIDPQHGYGKPKKFNKGKKSATIAALDWPLPPPASRLVTILPDLDSFGAVAVLNLRVQKVKFTHEMLERIELLAKSDNFEFGKWLEFVKTNPPPTKEIVELRGSLHPYDIRVLNAYLKNQPCGQKTNAVLLWFLHGELPKEGIELLRRQEKKAAIAFKEGKIKYQIFGGGRICYVNAPVFGATSIGYRFAPIVVAETILPFGRKITIAQFDNGHIDLAQVAKSLSEIENGWGGSETIIGSPQGENCVLDLDQIIMTVKENLN